MSCSVTCYTIFEHSLSDSDVLQMHMWNSSHLIIYIFLFFNNCLRCVLISENCIHRLKIKITWTTISAKHNVQSTCVLVSFNFTYRYLYEFYFNDYISGGSYGLSYKNNRTFVTYDREYMKNQCTCEDKVGWWNYGGEHANLNGEYIIPGTSPSSC